MKFFLLCVAMALVAGVAVHARADDGFRCRSGRLVSRGDHMMEVQKKCGAPDFVGQRTEKRKVKVKVRRWVRDHEEDISEEREVEILIDEWSYDLGPRKFIRRVSFENARVVDVATGDYGSEDG